MTSVDFTSLLKLLRDFLRYPSRVITSPEYTKTRTFLVFTLNCTYKNLCSKSSLYDDSVY